MKKKSGIYSSYICLEFISDAFISNHQKNLLGFPYDKHCVSVKIKHVFLCNCPKKFVIELQGHSSRPFLQSGTANVQEWQKILLAIPMNWQILGHLRTKAISRNDSFYSGMAVSLTCQSCRLACPQHLILPLSFDSELYTHVFL